jgi:hypothetical protein
MHKIIKAFFSKNYANVCGATIATQPNGLHILITHWAWTFSEIKYSQNIYPDLVYVGDVLFYIQGLIVTMDMETDPNVQYNNYINLNKKTK